MPSAFTVPYMVLGSRAPSFIGWKHQPYPTNHAISRYINNNGARKLQDCMKAISKIHQKTAKLFGAIEINVTGVFLKQNLKKLISP